MSEENPFTGRVVIGVDGSGHSHDAVRWGASYATRLRAEVALVLAWEMPVTTVHAMGYDPAIVDSAREAGQQTLGEAASVLRQTSPDVVAHTVLVPGGASGALIRASHEARCVVVGTRGHGALANLLLGSTSDAVAAQSTCPVFVVPEGARWQPGDRVLLASDGTEGSAAATRFALAEADRRGVGLEVITSVDVPTGVGTDILFMPGDMSELVSRAEQQVAAAVEAARPQGSTVAVEVSALAVPLDVAVEERSPHASLIVTGSRGRGTTMGILGGSASRQVMSGARCPVAVVKG